MLFNLPQTVEATRKNLIGWLRQCEEADRANARVVDKLMVAIPVELNRSERIALVEDFCHEVTGDRIPWIAAVHDRGDDFHNPHVHIIMRDRDLETGKRVLKTTERGSTERFRLQWEGAANKALLLAGKDVKIDHRSLAAQGADRIPTIHLGAAEPMERRGQRTVKGRLNRQVTDANAALEQAHRIVREAQAALEHEKRLATLENEPTLIGEISAGSDLRRKKREELLSEAYEQSMAGSELARYWSIRRTRRGLEFHNSAGRFIDRGDRLTALTGADLEIQAMLQVARAKGWATLHISGNADFCRRAVERARNSGFAVTSDHDHTDIETQKPIALLKEVARLTTRRKGRQR